MTEAVQNQNQIQETEPQENPISARIRNGIQRFVEKHTPEAHTQQMMRQYETILSRIPEGTLHTYAESLRPFMNRWTKATGYVQTVSEMVLPALVFGGAAYALHRLHKKGTGKDTIAFDAAGTNLIPIADVLIDKAANPNDPTLPTHGDATALTPVSLPDITKQAIRDESRKSPPAPDRILPTYIPILSKNDIESISESEPLPKTLNRATLLAKFRGWIEIIFEPGMSTYLNASKSNLERKLRYTKIPDGSGAQFQPERIPPSLLNFLGRLVFLLPDDEARRCAFEHLIANGGAVWDDYRKNVPESDEICVPDTVHYQNTTTSFDAWIRKRYGTAFDKDWFSEFLKQQFGHHSDVIDTITMKTGFSFRGWMKCRDQSLSDDFSVNDMKDWLKRL